jgi:hypothetical protein
MTSFMPSLAPILPKLKKLLLKIPPPGENQLILALYHTTTTQQGTLGGPKTSITQVLNLYNSSLLKYFNSLSYSYI